ncbi:MAG: fatty acid desaturase [Bryobacteraceae bacterium]
MSIYLVALITLAILQISVLWTTIYLHRGLTHKGLELHPALALLAHLHVAVFLGIAPREWVAVHRKHHHFSDQEGDPHSPRIYGLWQVLFGNVFYYGREAANKATVEKYTPDYKPDIIDKARILHSGLIWGSITFVAMFGWKVGLAAFAFHAVAYILLNSAINSVCHIVGYRNFNNLATNLQVLALFTGGEGLHNNHHEYPTSARFAVLRSEVDPAWPLIWMLERFRLARINRVALAKA